MSLVLLVTDLNKIIAKFITNMTNLKSTRSLYNIKTLIKIMHDSLQMVEYNTKKNEEIYEKYSSYLRTCDELKEYITFCDDFIMRLSKNAR